MENINHNERDYIGQVHLQLASSTYKTMKSLIKLLSLPSKPTPEIRCMWNLSRTQVSCNPKAPVPSVYTGLTTSPTADCLQQPQLPCLPNVSGHSTRRVDTTEAPEPKQPVQMQLFVS